MCYVIECNISKGELKMKKFMSEIIGNDKLTLRLGLDILNNNMPHAIIIEGPEGTGKRTLAKMISAALACTQKDSEQLPLPCLECVDCRKVIENKSPDVITLSREDKSTLGVDIIRFIKEDIHIIPNDLDFKIYIIEEADKMTEHAQNALLLSLEEPPSFVKFILLCENANKLLETIRSRAPIFRTMPIPNDLLAEHICEKDRRAAQMKLSSPKNFNELIKASAHGIGTALDYLDEKSFAPILSNRELAIDFCTAMICGGNYEVGCDILYRFSASRDTLTEQFGTILEALRDLIILKKSENAELLFFSDRDKAIELCDRSTLSFLFKAIEAVDTAIYENMTYSNIKLLTTKLVTSVGLI